MNGPARRWRSYLRPAAYCLCGICCAAGTSAFAALTDSAADTGARHDAFKNTIWQQQAKAAVHIAEGAARRYGWQVAIIPTGAARDDSLTRAALGKVRAWTRVTPYSADASLKVARMIEGAQKAATPAQAANEPGGSATSLYFGKGRDLCIIQLTTNSMSLADALGSAFNLKAVAELAVRARTSGVTAADIAFWVSAHESAHCLLGTAIRAHVIDTAWSRQFTAPRTWRESKNADDPDDATLARTEEIAADMLAAAWARQARSPGKAAALIQLVQRGRRLGAYYDEDDSHESSRALTRHLPSHAGRHGSDLLVATWKLAKEDTRYALAHRYRR